MDANTQYLNRYLDKQQEESLEYEAMLAELRAAEEEDYEYIIESYGYYSSDLDDILGDL